MSAAIDDGGSAFPQHGWTNDPATLERMKNQGGMSLRDYFAAKALAGLLASTDDSDDFPNAATRKNFASFAYWMADAMLAEREREQP